MPSARRLRRSRLRRRCQAVAGVGALGWGRGAKSWLGTGQRGKMGKIYGTGQRKLRLSGLLYSDARRLRCAEELRGADTARPERRGALLFVGLMMENEDNSWRRIRDQHECRLPSSGRFFTILRRSSASPAATSRVSYYFSYYV